MTRKEYSGWANYETWNAALWLNNEQGSYSYCTEEAQRCYDEASGEDRLPDATNELAEVIKSLFEQEADENTPQCGWMADAVNAYLSEVDWYEIAEHYLSDVEKEEA